MVRGPGHRPHEGVPWLSRAPQGPTPVLPQEAHLHRAVCGKLLPGRAAHPWLTSWLRVRMTGHGDTCTPCSPALQFETKPGEGFPQGRANPISGDKCHAALFPRRACWLDKAPRGCLPPRGGHTGHRPAPWTLGTRHPSLCASLLISRTPVWPPWGARSQQHLNPAHSGHTFLLLCLHRSLGRSQTGCQSPIGERSRVLGNMAPRAMLLSAA